LPTFFWPVGLKGGPPLEAVGGGGAGEDDAGVDNEDPPPKWQPVFPFWVDGPGPEQMPVWSCTETSGYYQLLTAPALHLSILTIHNTLGRDYANGLREFAFNSRPT
jgi:hypothetical protein